MDKEQNNTILSGFSKLSHDEKLQQTAFTFDNPELVKREFDSFLYTDTELRHEFLGISENTISSFHLPYSLIPNMLVDGNVFHVPAVTEESSVVAAAAASAKFWCDKGGFNTISSSIVKVGQVHFYSNLPFVAIATLVAENENKLRQSVDLYTKSMESRGGGILSFNVIRTVGLDGYFQLQVEFNTVDSMGANFINTCLEELAPTLKHLLEDTGSECTILMSILSNFTPNCVVRIGVNAPIKSFKKYISTMSPQDFAHRFKDAVDIAKSDIYRAVTHNKGIMNGVDGVVIATGNDFRAIEAASHAYASRNGSYTSLSSCKLEGGDFYFELELPMPLGVVGGLTKLHPLAKRSLELLNHPTAQKLMSIVASVGLASNFAAVKSLVTGGIQQGHMKMHLNNILKSYNATTFEVEKAFSWFAVRKVSNAAVKSFLDELRG